MSEDFGKATPLLPLMAHDGDIWTDYGDGVPGIPVFRRASQDRRWGVRLTDDQFDALAALIVAAVNGYETALARIAELEKALRLVLEQRDLSIQGRLHPMGELEIIALARAALAPEPQP